MYSAPPAIAAQSNPARRGFLAGGPLIALCCLGAILFLIAATIVIALIPVYLPTKRATGDELIGPYYFTMNPDQPMSGPDGELDQSARDAIAQQVDNEQGFPAGSTVVSSGSVRTPASKRKRRALILQRNRRQFFPRLMFCTIFFRRRRCGRCRLKKRRFSISVVFFFNGFRVTTVILINVGTSPSNIPTLAPGSGSGSGSGGGTTTVAGGGTTTAAGGGTTTAAGGGTTTAAGGGTTTAAGGGTTTAAGGGTTTAAGGGTTTAAGGGTTASTTTTTAPVTSNILG